MSATLCVCLQSAGLHAFRIVRWKESLSLHLASGKGPSAAPVEGIPLLLPCASQAPKWRWETRLQGESHSRTCSDFHMPFARAFLQEEVEKSVGEDDSVHMWKAFLCTVKDTGQQILLTEPGKMTAVMPKYLSKWVFKAPFVWKSQRFTSRNIQWSSV